ncbi:hypothetical protein DFH06DRAFT_191327 [Mycena polygramma]|nr:hypothetical protein DFH06DRAFT_191327 [Mycena polygramma]
MQLLNPFSRRRQRPSSAAGPPVPLASLAWLPQDILAEICWYLGPQELYSLSRTCRSIRLFLTSRSNAGPIWREAFQDAVADDSLPHCPFTQCELRWAHLLFGGFCSACFVDFGDPVPGVGVLWKFNARYCDSCFPSHFQKRLPHKLEKHLPRHEWGTLFPSIPHPSTETPLYWSNDIKSFTKEYSSSPLAERDDCIARRRYRTDATNLHAQFCMNWESAIPRVEPQPRLRDVNIRDRELIHEQFITMLLSFSWYRTMSLPTDT